MKPRLLKEIVDEKVQVRTWYLGLLFRKHAGLFAEVLAIIIFFVSKVLCPYPLRSSLQAIPNIYTQYVLRFGVWSDHCTLHFKVLGPHLTCSLFVLGGS